MIPIELDELGINCYGTDAKVPFGGYKQSGLGRESGSEGLAEYLETKAIALPGGFSPFPSSWTRSTWRAGPPRRSVCLG